MHLATILRDRRERRPWEFGPYAVETRDVTLSTGDYTIAEWCVHDADTDTYHPSVAIERKTGHDFLNSITWERDRFESELRRARSWPRPLWVVVEESWETFAENRGLMHRRDIDPGQVAGTVSAWSGVHNVEFRFPGSRRAGQLYALCRLLRRKLDVESHQAGILRKKLETLYLLVRAETGSIEEVGLSVDEPGGQER